MEQILTALLWILLLIPAVVIMVLPVALWRGFVLTKLWAWFIVPTFGLPMLTMIPAIGLSLVVGMFIPYNKTEDSKEYAWDNYLTNGFLLPAIALIFGYIATLVN